VTWFSSDKNIAYFCFHHRHKWRWFSLFSAKNTNKTVEGEKKDVCHIVIHNGIKESTIKKPN